MIWETVRLALSSIRRNVLRSILTLLGIVIGVAAVIAMITIGSGTTQKVKDDISKLGSNLLVVRAGGPPSPGGPRIQAKALKDTDVAAVIEHVHEARAVSGAAQQSARVISGTDSLSVSVTGADTGYFTARDWGVAVGREYTDQEERGGAAVCILGQTVRSQFFGVSDPTGQAVRIGRMSCTIIGVLEAKGTSGFGQDQDLTVLMPLTTFQRRMAGNRDVDTIYIAGDDTTAMDEMQESVEETLRVTRRVPSDRDDDFSVRDMTQVADTMASATTVMTGMLGALAGVSLLVGGIGIMNIMLVSVTERTREIGIRLAIGAQERDILLQFLVEATVLSTLGGLVGIALGLGLAGLAATSMAIPFVPSFAVIALAVSFSGIIGMAFGFFPALRAARLDPIDALRHE
ncbi:MAG: ABC transporter permease [Mesorhizobium sp.]